MGRWLQPFLHHLENLPFEERGHALKTLLLDMRDLQRQYRDWRHRYACHVFSQLLPRRAQVELSIDFDIDDGLCDFWGISILLEKEHYLPAHWLMEGFFEVQKGAWETEWHNWREALSKAGVDCSKHVWECLQDIKELVEEDLEYWSENTLFFDSTEL
ncbi:MAG: hypothetical protein VX278_01980 [Myxococcota bacterium]|nr:hypothetical protein [Myxococcota bacterium]